MLRLLGLRDLGKLEQQPAAHADELAPQSWEHERQLAAGTQRSVGEHDATLGTRTQRSAGLEFLGQRAAQRFELGRARRDDGQRTRCPVGLAVLLEPSAGQGVDGPRPQIGRDIRETAQPGRQGVWVVAADDEEALGARRGPRLGVPGVLAQDRVGRVAHRGQGRDRGGTQAVGAVVHPPLRSGGRGLEGRARRGRVQDAVVQPQGGGDDGQQARGRARVAQARCGAQVQRRGGTGLRAGPSRPRGVIEHVHARGARLLARPLQAARDGCGGRLGPQRARGARGAEAIEGGVHPLAPLQGVRQPHQHQRRGALARRTEAAGGLRANPRPHVRAQAHRPDQGQVEVTGLQGARRDRERGQAGALLGAERVARTAELQLARDPARAHAGQSAHRAIRRQGRPERVAQATDPRVEGCARRRAPQRLGPPGRLGADHPAQVVVRGAEVELDPREHAAARAWRERAAAIGHRLRRAVEQEQLLREQLGQLGRRDAKPSHRDIHGVDEPSRRRVGQIPEPGLGRGGGVVGVVEQPLAQRVDRGPGPDVDAEANEGEGCHGSRRCLDLDLDLDLAADWGRARAVGMLQQHVGVGAPEAEARDRRAPRASGPWPGHGVHGQHQPRVLDREPIAGLPQVGDRGDPSVGQGQHGADGRHRTGSGQQVADVGLRGAQVGGCGVPRPLRAKLPQALELHRVADQRPGRVTLDQLDVPGDPAGLRVRRPHRPQLPLGGGREQPPVDVVGQARAANEGVHGVAVGPRVFEPLQREHGRALPHHQPVAGGVEGRAAPRGTERSQLREAHLGVQRAGSREASSQHQVGFTPPQLVHRDLHREQRGGAGGIEGERVAAQAQGAGQDARGKPGDPAVPHRGRRLGRRRQPQARLQGAPDHPLRQRVGAVGGQHDVAQHDRRPVPVHGAQGGPGLGRRGQQDLHRGVERRALVRQQVEARQRHLPRRVLEQAGAIAADPIGRRTPGADRLSRRQHPAPRGHRARRIASLRDELPQRVHVGRTGEHRSHRDDCDRAVHRYSTRLRAKAWARPGSRVNSAPVSRASTAPLPSYQSSSATTRAPERSAMRTPSWVPSAGNGRYCR